MVATLGLCFGLQTRTEEHARRLTLFPTEQVTTLTVQSQKTK
jgi:CTP synthase (UTP-ammonia lyase)